MPLILTVGPCISALFFKIMILLVLAVLPADCLHTQLMHLAHAVFALSWSQKHKLFPILFSF